MLRDRMTPPPTRRGWDAEGTSCGRRCRGWGRSGWTHGVTEDLWGLKGRRRVSSDWSLNGKEDDEGLSFDFRSGVHMSVVCPYTPMCTCLCLCVFVYLCVSARLGTRVCMCLYLGVCLYTPVCTCLYVSVCFSCD